MDTIPIPEFPPVAVAAYVDSRITLQLEHGELPRYHRDDCASLGAGTEIRAAYTDELVRTVPDACDCDGSELLEDQLRAIRAGIREITAVMERNGSLQLPMGRVLWALAEPWRDRADFPRL
jgi:hypothetical protein